jgi:hypothetical protein
VVIEVFAKISLERIGAGVNWIAQIKGQGGNGVAQLETVFFNLILEGAAADAQEFGCLRPILIGFI